MRGLRYHVPKSVREHVDFITPGITMREVSNVSKRSNTNLQKRFINPLPPILEPITVPLEMLLDNLLFACDAAVTPECIKRELPGITESYPSRTRY